MSDSHSGIILLRAIDSVREAIVSSHSVKLRSRLIHHGRPVFSTIFRYLRSPIIGNDHSLIVGRIYPEVMVITVRSIGPFKSLTSISGFVITHIEHIERLLILRIGIDSRIVPSTLTQISVFIYPFPSLSGIFGGKYSPVIIFNDCIESVGIFRRNSNSHDAKQSFGESSFS